MLTLLTTAALALAAQAAPATPAPQETTIAFAANGGIHNFEAGPRGSGVVFLQARNLRWYKVTLSSDCLPNGAFQTLIFKTNVNGTFDRFSRIGSTRYPGRLCGVNSIVRSDPPPGQPGAKKAAKKAR